LLALALASVFACSESAQPLQPGSDDDDTARDATLPNGATRDATVSKPSDSGAGGAPAEKDSATAPPAPGSNVQASTDAAVLDGGTPPEADSGPALEIPAPVDAAYVWGIGIGITDVPAAVKFYTEVMKMTVEKEAVKREDRTETVLFASQAKRGARLVLMKFDDMRNTRKITSKIVWQSQNASAVRSAASKYPDYVSRLNFGIVQFDGPETYIQEVGGIFDTEGGSITVPYPIVLGFSVSDIAASRKFYTSLGMTEGRLGSFSVTDATGTGNITEYSEKFSTGSALVLQDWTPERNSKDNPLKAVLFVPDAKAFADKVVAAGGSIVREAERSPAYDNRLLIVAKDLDGVVLELVQ
jgi:predicted enzyme related to lactoylglutathione lyase